MPAKITKNLPDGIFVYILDNSRRALCVSVKELSKNDLSTELTQQQRTRDMAPLIITTLDATYFHQGWIPTISCLPPHHLSLTF